MQTIVLSGSIRETYAWARAQERNLRSVRHVANAASVAGRNFDGIVELPSYIKRRDRHAVNAALRQLKRRLPNLTHTVESDWVMPKPVPKPDAPTGNVYLFANAPVIEPLGDLWFKAVEMEAEEDFGEPEAVVNEMPEEIKDLTDADVHRITVADAPEVTPEVTVEAPVTVQPKKKGRRTNEQKAYDEALADWENNGGSAEALESAKVALVKRHPDDERLQNIEIRQTPNDLDF